MQLDSTCSGQVRISGWLGIGIGTAGVEERGLGQKLPLTLRRPFVEAHLKRLHRVAVTLVVTRTAATERSSGCACKILSMYIAAPAKAVSSARCRSCRTMKVRKKPSIPPLFVQSFFNSFVSRAFLFLSTVALLLFPRFLSTLLICRRGVRRAGHRSNHSNRARARFSTLRVQALDPARDSGLVSFQAHYPKQAAGARSAGMYSTYSPSQQKHDGRTKPPGWNSYWGLDGQKEMYIYDVRVRVV